MAYFATVQEVNQSLLVKLYQRATLLGELKIFLHPIEKDWQVESLSGNQHPEFLRVLDEEHIRIRPFSNVDTYPSQKEIADALGQLTLQP